MFVFADKSRSLYQMSSERYKNLVHGNITKTYQKAAVNTKRNVDKESKRFAKSINLDDKMEWYSDQNTFITLKDHKENFRNNTKCRLINPLKSEVGLISKKYLSNIISEVKENTTQNQWPNTSTVIGWFKNLGNKNKHKFIKFDIVEFYPSISEELLDQAINYVKQYTDICDNVITAIKRVRKSLRNSMEDYIGTMFFKQSTIATGHEWINRERKFYLFLKKNILLLPLIPTITTY